MDDHAVGYETRQVQLLSRRRHYRLLFGNRVHIVVNAVEDQRNLSQL